MKDTILMTTFTDLGLIEPLLRALTAEGYSTPTPIQAQAIPQLLRGGDVLGIAQTGTGKTAAFALPILQRLTESNRKLMPKSPRALILTPTRELALQILEGFTNYGKHLPLKRAIMHGGVSERPQIDAVRNGADILVATPGRLLDLLNQRHVNLSQVEVFVLDEADRMLDMGFIRDVRQIAAKVSSQRQTLLFSATMPNEIMDLAKSLLREYQRIEVTPPSTTVERIAQHVMFVSRDDKRKLLNDILQAKSVTRALVFTRTKHGANRVAEHLAKAGIKADAIHGNKSQGARQRSLAAFKSGNVRVLVATDIAARGIDVDGVSHVINFELPMEPESYVHRIGRTARAGAEGIAVSFCDDEEVGQLRAIERSIRQPVPVDESHPYHAPHIASRTGGGPKKHSGNRNHSGGKPGAGKGGKPGGGKQRRRSGGGGGGKSGGRPWDNRSSQAA
jgi:ATP-dependent RNA helicase RhlE